MSKNRKSESLAEELPYWEFADQPFPHVILSDGSLSAGMKMSLLDIECLSDSQVNQVAQTLRGALNSMSEGLSVQFNLSVRSDYSDMLYQNRSLWAKDIHPLIQKIGERRHSELQCEIEDGELYRPELRVYLRTKVPKTRRLKFFRKQEEFHQSACEGYEETVEVLKENIDALTVAMGQVGLQCKGLSGDEFVSHIYQLLNPKRSEQEPPPVIRSPKDEAIDEKLIEEVEWLAPASPREQLVFGDLVLGFEGFTLDSKIHKVITLKTMPESTYAGQLSNFLRMPFHYDLTLQFEIPPQASEMAKLQQKRKIAHSLASAQVGRAADLESESKLSSAEDLIRELINTGQRVYATQLSIILREPVGSNGQKRLNRQVREVLSRFRSLQGAEGLEESVGAWKITKGMLPAAPINLERPRKMKTNNLADFLPIYGPREGDLEPAVIFRNRMNGLISYDPFDRNLPNYNCLVTGSSGAGKSFLNNCILLQEMARKMRVFIIDIGGSYKKLTEALGGQYLEIDLSDRYCINPFHIPNGSVDPPPSKVKSLLAIIETMVADEVDSKLSKLDRALLEKEIIELYEKFQTKSKVPTLSDLAALLESSGEENLRRISKLLYMWTGNRAYGRLLDGLGSLRTDSPICTFDLKGLSSHPDLQSVMILILTDFILTQVEFDKDHKKRIILDEAWELLRSSSAASFMEYCARTLRKTGSGITFITQGVEEIVSSPIGSAIMNNTATKFIMLQRGDSEILRESLKLNPQELSLIHSLQQKKGEYSEGFLIEGDHRQVIRIHPGPIEYWLSTSDSQDNAYLAKLQNDDMTLAEAIKQAATHYPNGVANKRGGECEKGQANAGGSNYELDACASPT